MTDVGDLSWDQVERRLDRGALAILPVGAGAKEHGQHLPMRTDQIQAEWLARRLAENVDALIWPTLTYGFYPAFVDYPGSASLSAETFEACVRGITGGLIGFGARAVLILDVGISTIPPIDRAIASLGDQRAVHLKVHEGPRYRETAARLEIQSHGGHADELETSRMLVLAPELVTMARATLATSAPLQRGPLQRSEADGPNYSPSGATGDPRAATREKGEAMLQAMLADLEEAVARIA